MLKRLWLAGMVVTIGWGGLGTAHGEATPAAQKWLEKMAATVSGSAYSADFTMDMSMAQGGMNMKMIANGSMTQKDAKHMAMTMAMTMTGLPPGSPGGGPGGMQMDQKMIMNGDGMWMEMNSPMMGGRQVMKMSRATMEKMQGQMPGAAPGMGGSDPVAQIRQMAEQFDLDVIDESGGSVTLSAERVAGAPVPGMPPAMQQQMGTMKLVLDGDTGFPVEMRMGGEQPVMVMKFSNFKKLEHVDESIFEYTPPAGVRVMDMDAMMQGTMPMGRPGAAPVSPSQ